MPTITGIVIPADTETPISTVEFERGDISVIQNVVGGYFGVIDTTPHQSSIWIHDEGKLIGLPVNLRATLYVWLDSVWREHDVNRRRCSHHRATGRSRQHPFSAKGTARLTVSH